MTDKAWPFPDSPNMATFTTVNVLRNGDPILLVTHDADDGAWQFLCGKTNDPKDGLVICLADALRLDRAVAEPADLPCGWRAWREDVSSPWQREPRPSRDQDDDGV